MTSATKRRAAELYAKRVAAEWLTLAGGALKRFYADWITGRMDRVESAIAREREIAEWADATMADCIREAEREQRKGAKRK